VDLEVDHGHLLWTRSQGRRLVSRWALDEAEQLTAFFHGFRRSLVSRDPRYQDERFLKENLRFRPELVSHHVQP
jgi:hypothetical protein